MSQENTEMSEAGMITSYWRLYGGVRAITGSWYFWVALFLSFALFPVWMEEIEGVRIWTEDAAGIIPSLMAFPLGGMAILLAIATTDLFDTVHEDGRTDTLYMSTMASFFHFILLQTLSLVAVLATQAYPINLFSWLGFFMMTYGMLVAIAVAGNLLQLAQMLKVSRER